MYLPCEGLFAEALNIPGLAEDFQLNYRVCIAGPSTLAALVNSLQLGFRTLAVQQRTTEVWQQYEPLCCPFDEAAECCGGA